MQYMKVILNRPLGLSDIFHKANVSERAVSLWATPCALISQEFALTFRLFVCQPAFLSSCMAHATKPPFLASLSEPVSLSSSYQRTKPWCSYVMTEGQKQGGGFLSCVRFLSFSHVFTNIVYSSEAAGEHLLSFRDIRKAIRLNACWVKLRFCLLHPCCFCMKKNYYNFSVKLSSTAVHIVNRAVQL